jgi:hypothetical protein
MSKKISRPESNSINPVTKSIKGMNVKDGDSSKGLISKDRIAPHRKVIQDAALMQLGGMSTPHSVCESTVGDESHTADDDYEASKAAKKKNSSRVGHYTDSDLQAVRDLDAWTPKT